MKISGEDVDTRPVRELLPLNPHLLSFGEESMSSLTEWLEKPVRIRPLSQLKEASHRRYKLLQSILNEVRRK